MVKKETSNSQDGTKTPRIRKHMAEMGKASADQPTYDNVLRKNLFPIDGRPSRQDRDKLLKEVEYVLMEISVPTFKWTSKYGLLA